MTTNIYECDICGYETEYIYKKLYKGPRVDFYCASCWLEGRKGQAANTFGKAIDRAFKKVYGVDSINEMVKSMTKHILENNINLNKDKKAKCDGCKLCHSSLKVAFQTILDMIDN